MSTSSTSTKAPPATPSPELAQWLAAETLSLCRIASVTGDERAITDYLQQRCGELGPGLAIERQDNVLLVRARAADGGQRPLVALFGHTDTVKPAHDQKVAIEEAQGRVYGCGASDMKGGLAVMLRLLADSAELGRDLLCVFYDKEEGPAPDSGLVPLCEDGAPRLRDIDLALCLEPTDNLIHAGCVGSLHVTVTAHGRRAHSARPWQGDNAIYAAIPLLTRLAALTRREVAVQGLRFYEVVTATQARTDNSRNVVPDRFTVNVNYRFAPGKTPQQAGAELLALIGPGYTTEIIDEAPAGSVCLTHPLLASWVDRLGLDVEAKQAWTDVARLTALGLPAVNFGPGDTAQAHQANESVAISALGYSYQALRQLLLAE
jgi:succinyl-diaminopimelate desuccinylase